ncbi:MAG: hypothetical protein L6R36_005209 [Xanthoria steineri]|nr:MAG: hypothetical protein L6R36_005209 [Xanthoria steineri]
MRALELVTRWMGMSIKPHHNHQVKTSNGIIIGHEAPNASQVVEYLGIPYAQPPIGDLRFAAPVAYKGNAKSVFNASEGCPIPASSPPSRPYPAATAQFNNIVVAFTGSIDKNRSEDCLTLNIWSKTTANKSKPVIVFFHGGRYTTGTSNTPFYYGQHLANTQDIIVVTLNFRLNIFGFPGAPSTAQNLGLRDQRLAVQWLHTNIRAFGGNPHKIVIAGQSSGSVAVDYWAFAYKENPLVAGYIQHSGNALSFGVNSNEVARGYWYNVSALLGCGEEGDTLPCMRAIDNITAIEEAAGKIKAPASSNPGRSSPVFQPTPDGVTVFDDYVARYKRGDFSRLPTLLGQTHSEASWYKIPAYQNQNTTLPPALWSSFNLASFTCPTAFAALSRSSYSTPVYRFRYFGDWDNLRFYGPSAGNGNENGSGAYHGSDVQMVVGNSVGVSGGVGKSAEEARMEGVMGGAWAAFARDPGRGLEGVGWGRYVVGEGGLVRLGFGGKGEATFGRGDEFDGGCGNVTLEG